MSAIEYEFSIGQSRRIEQSTTVFKEATTLFPGVTSVIGGPVYGGWIPGFLDDAGGWQFQVDSNNTNYIQLLLDTNGGFDPRKSPGTTFSTISTAIADFTNNWARSFFEPSSALASDDIKGSFPGLRARLEPVIAGDAITLIPLSVPNAGSDHWWDPDTNNSLLTSAGSGPLTLPKSGIKDDGSTVAFSPSVGTEYKVWVYALAISDANPVHIYAHPVDIWENLRIEAGIPYDSSVLSSLKSLLGDSLRLALRISDSYKLADFDQKVIYGPFRLSSRLENGERVLFSTDVSNNAAPTETITLNKLRSYDTTVFDLDEDSAITTVTVKTKSIVKWSTEEGGQPDIDALIVREAYPQSLENSDDDIPAGTEREVVLGDIPGMIWVDGSGPINLTQFLTNLGSELFDRFGRGGIVCELDCLPSVTSKLGKEVLLDLPHLPGADLALDPISQRDIGPQAFQIISRTEQPEGPRLKLINSLSTEAAGGDIELLPTFTLDVSTEDGVQYGGVIITNADDLYAAMLNCRCDYAIGATEPTSTTLYTTILWEFMTSPTFGFDVGPVDGGSTLWVRLRAESPGFRPGPWTALQSVDLTAP